jgi:hypothetical protein
VNRKVGVAAGIAAPVALIAGWVAYVAVSLGHPCGGDGGNPYAEPGSAAAHFCDRGGVPLAWLLPLVGVLAGAAVATRRDPVEASWWVGCGLLGACVIDAIVVVYANGLAVTA